MKLETRTRADGLKIKKYTFDGGTVIYEYDGWLEIQLPDGRHFSACPETNLEYECRARSLGYVMPDGNADIWGMCRDHDRLHARIAELFGLSCSPALDRSPSNLPPNEVTDAEEQLVIAWQRYANVLKREGIV
jgi:hypothetical protein